jgi:RimJ/RimL family protein N-acetyltransferase
MRKLIRYLQARGTHRLVGTVLAANTRMLELAERLGFEVGPPDVHEGTRAIHLTL